MTRRMATRDPLAWLPGDRYVHERDLDYRPSERVKVAFAYAVAFVVVLGFVALLGLVGQS